MPKSPNVSDPAWLAAAFAEPGTTVAAVAARAGCDEKTVRRWLKRFGLSTRNVGETASLRQASQDPLPARTLEVIEGELLGDGNLVATSRGDAAIRYAARYQHNTKHRPYLDWLADRLVGIDCTFYGPYGIPPRGVVHSLQTGSYAALAPLYLRWYDETRPPRNRKIVPAELQVTPTVALHWYLGDGHLLVDRRNEGTKPAVRLSTDSFDEPDVERLAAQLAAFRPRIGRFGNGLRIVVDSAPFLAWIGPCPVPDVYGYKWDASLRP